MRLLTAAVCLTVPVLIAANCETGPNTDAPKPLPFLPKDDDHRGVAIWTEVSSSQLDDTFVVREVYDRTTNRTFLEFYDGNSFEKLLYDHEKALLYSYTDEICATRLGNETDAFYQRFELFKLLKLRRRPNGQFLGPASFFADFTSPDNTFRYGQKACNEDEDEPQFDRPIACFQYIQCGTTRTDFWYSEDGYPIFNQNKSQALRAKLQSGVTIDVLSIKTFDKKDLMDLFVPTGLSCSNPLEKNLKVPFADIPRTMEGELVVTTKESKNAYISQFSGVVIPSFDKEPRDATKMPGLYSFTWNTFSSTETAKDYKPGDRIKFTHDVDRGVVYQQIFSKDKDESSLEKDNYCKILPDSGIRAEIEIPFFGTFDLTPLLLQAPVDQANVIVNHLGPNRMRFTDTDVYEVTYPDYLTGYGRKLSTFVVSYHFNANFLSETRAVELVGYEDGKRVFSGVIHISRFDGEVVALNEKVRIDDCYDYIDSSELRWFQIGFQAKTPEDLNKLRDDTTQVREAFLNKLYSEYRVAPMRIPIINIDPLPEQLLISVLLLERPILENAFGDGQMPLAKDFRKPARVLGIMSLSACQILCLSMTEKECTAISYCGATCSVSTEKFPAAPINTIDSPGCSLYERSYDRTISVSNVILRSLQSAVTTKVPQNQFTLSVRSNDSEVLLTADSFDDTKNFDNAFHFDKDKVAIIESSFSLAHARKRYKTDSSAKLLGSLSLEDCAVACKNRQDCETFSFCQNSRECYVSKNHDVNVEETESDDQCIIYQNKYLDRFEKLPGLTVQAPGSSVVTTNAESCAQKCVSSDECKSFEFCESSGDCTTLATHIADAVVEKSDATLKCNHYSKRFLFDYTVVPGKKGTGDETTVLAEYNATSQATCAKLCSEWGGEKVCLSFDFCASGEDNTGVCNLRTVDSKIAPSPSPTCNWFYATAPPNKLNVKHGAGSSFAFSILMIFIGIGVGFGGFFAYAKFRAV